MRLVSVVGARPQFVKLAVMCRAVAEGTRVASHHIIHTGQHYDVEMNDVFFRDLDIPEPDAHLGVGSGSHSAQTAEAMTRLEPVLRDAPADWVVLYGDTNSTLAGALVAAKLGLRIAHVEAGLRSYNRQMPEEINRVTADHLSDLLLCPTPTAVRNLAREGLQDRAVLVGDVMYDAALRYRDVAEGRGGDLAETWRPGTFALATVHRQENTDDVHRLATILGALDRIAERICPVLLPLHPRTRKAMAEAGLSCRSVTTLRPVSYLEMLLLEGRARFVLTDSGGVQKESYFVRTPCITLRNETEWVETLENRCNVLAGADEEAICAAAGCARQAGPWTAVYGDGRAAQAMLGALEVALMEP
ncbi:MAG: UDP-N-acetylglucosamine 2-epimerase (non-hydrolyzing) [Planctomycetes bacterium]|nr:UDP-N-acetylglucosamine 2-epimerase (non-hydrolyzing) [Planctomycetota bacterium]